MTRRDLLQRAGIGAAAVVTVAGTGIAWRMAQQSVLAPGTGDAYAAWSARLLGDGTLSLVRAAVLAANAHDSQPWLFEIADGRIDLFADRTRNIGALDPLLREMEVSIGCAIENLTLAAPANGLAAKVQLLPTADRDHIARIALAPGVTEESSLFAAIPQRRTDRSAYAPRAVDRSMLEALAGLADDPTARLEWIDADPARSRFGALTVDATAAIVADPDQSRDDFRWYRQDWEEIQRRRDGITMDTSGLPDMLRVAVRTLPPSSASAMQGGWIDSTRSRSVATAAAYGLVVVRDRADTRSRIAAGRLFQRVHLSSTTRGLALQPLNQVIERVDREATSSLGSRFSDALSALTPAGWQAVMAFRIGYPTETPCRAPRRWAEEVIRVGRTGS